MFCNSFVTSRVIKYRIPLMKCVSFTYFHLAVVSL